MAETFRRVVLVRTDLMRSWYFRLWAVLWLAAAAVAFAAFVRFADRSIKADDERDFLVRRVSVSRIDWPAFHLRVGWKEGDNDARFLVDDKSCEHMGVPIQTGPCRNYPDRSLCFSLITANVYGEKSDVRGRGLQDVESIRCNVTVMPVSLTGNQIILFGLEQPGPYGDMPVPVRPTADARIFLGKEIVRPSHGDAYVYWSASISYHSSQSIAGSYMLHVIIPSFDVLMLEQANSYSGWMAMGDTGGFAFFMALLHSAVMILAGFALANDSQFLANANVDVESDFAQPRSVNAGTAAAAGAASQPPTDRQALL